jgi:hypothetical protein
MEQWNQFLNDKLSATGTDTDVDLMKFRVDAYEEFTKAAEHVNTYAALHDMFYWHPGHCSLQLELATIHPDNKFIKTWEFRLTEQNSNLLKLNIVNVLREICGVPRFPYNFAYPKYQTAPNA